nr:MAG TPA: Photosystem Q(B) protein [Caudoviricetes sp.]
MASDFAGKCKNLLYTTLLLKISFFLIFFRKIP